MLAMTAACGGESFVYAPDASNSIAPGPDAAVDAGPVSLFLLCGGNTCQPVSGLAPNCCATTGDVHCVTGGGLCNSPCDTRLACTSNDNCPSVRSQCCVGPSVVGATCTSKTFASQCKVTCPAATDVPMCNPSASPSTCPTGKTCQNSASVLQSWGLPAGQGYGICE